MAFSKYFEHKQCEGEIYRRWEEAGAFRADADSGRPPFTISMPPPNATGTLHMGHAIGMAVEDLMTRWRRMSGDEALWVPGTDHAAIATESVVIQRLQAQGMKDPRGELGREELVSRIADFVAQSRSAIRSQIRALGASCDWTRERYTMEPALNRCVNSVFARMFRDGLIYRGMRIVNWDPALQTTVSDDEIYYQDRQAKFYTMRYGPFLVGTSRPETKLGDTAVAVHPEDERWKEHIGKTYEVAWPKGPTISVRVVGDRHVDPETGSGVLGVTPAHSQIDFEIAQQHHLPLIQVIDEDGRMTEAAGPYAGMTVQECRKAFVADLQDAGLMEKIESYLQPISLCYRSKQPIEPLPKNQWFIDVNKPAVLWEGKRQSLRQLLRSVVESGQIRLLPEHEEKTYFHWIDNLRDWCISRQIWWGHRIPVWYRGAKVSDGKVDQAEETYVGHRKPDGSGWVQDPDTLDTWFSSALWTWSTLTDPQAALDEDLDLDQILERSPDFQRFHPTSVMETAYDILFFWVARMILMTTYSTGQIPFHTVYLHGLILDCEGEKMSKSKPETCIDPLDTIEEFGADALRLAMLLGNSAGTDLKLGQDKIVACKRLINKIWNAAKLVERTSQGREGAKLSREMVSHPVNQWMLTRSNALIQHVGRRMQAFAFGDAAEQIRSSFWGEFCDFYLEAIKVEELSSLPETVAVLNRSLDDYLKLFHPFMPFLTEQVWGNLKRPGMLIRADWPEFDSRLDWPEDAQAVQAVVRAVAAVRSMRVEQGIDPGSPVQLRLEPRLSPGIFESCRPVIEKLARASQLVIADGQPGESDQRASVAVDEAWRISLTLSAADLEAERQRLAKQLEGGQKRLQSLQSRLNNPGFLKNAPAPTVESARADAVKLQAT
ncbi:MAG: valine--tRNA ligase, partial [Acidobacteriota bacterium]